MTRKIPGRERGAALLAVLLMVGVMGAIAATLLERTRTAARLVSNLLAREQAASLSHIAETLAIRRIAGLMRDGGVEMRAGSWQGQPILLPMPGGTASLVARDGGNCFNLNSLVTMAGPNSLVARPLAVEQFTTLLEVMEVPRPRAAALAAATADWIDSDDQPLPLGAEDSRYASLGYRTGGTLMVEASEWRAVTGVDAALYARLRPLVCALPMADLSPINPDTLGPGQVPLLAMLLPATAGPAPARRQLAMRLLAARPPGGWASVSEFTSAGPLRDAPLPGDVLQQLSVQTRWFALDFSVLGGDQPLAASALVDARSPLPRIAARRWQADE